MDNIMNGTWRQHQPKSICASWNVNNITEKCSKIRLLKFHSFYCWLLHQIEILFRRICNCIFRHSRFFTMCILYSFIRFAVNTISVKRFCCCGWQFYSYSTSQSFGIFFFWPKCSFCPRADPSKLKHKPKKKNDIDRSFVIHFGFSCLVCCCFLCFLYLRVSCVYIQNFYAWRGNVVVSKRKEIFFSHIRKLFASCFSNFSVRSFRSSAWSMP